MKLEKFFVKNFRSIQRLEINTAESSIITLIGSISVGKSSVLRSLELFWNEYLYDQERENLQDRIFFSNVQHRQKQTSIEAEWHFLCTNETVEQTQFDDSDKIKQFLMEKNPSKIILKIKFDPANDKKPERYVGWRERDSEQPKDKELFNNSIQWMTDDPYSSEIENFHLDFGSRLIFRFRADFNVNVELYINKLQEKPKEKKSLEKLISKVFGENIVIDYVERPNGKNKSMFHKAVILRRDDGTVQPFAFLSHSSKKLLAMLMTINTSNNHYPESTNGKLHESLILPKILLIDSPEIGDPRAQRALAEILIDYAHPHQIFLSTQSPRFMLGSVYLVKLYNSSTIVTPITTQTDIEQIVSILGIKPSDSLSSDAVVFVEGITDAVVFRIFLEKIERAENLIQGPLVSFVPVDGWSKMTFTISLRILKSKFVRTYAYAIVDGDTWSQADHFQKDHFQKIQHSFENMFGHKTFLRLKEECLESIFLANPSCISKLYSADVNIVRERINHYKNLAFKDKDCLKELVKEFSSHSHIYASDIASKLAYEFEIDQIPDRILRLFRKILWDSKK
jgi:hypothetical protein